MDDTFVKPHPSNVYSDGRDIPEHHLVSAGIARKLGLKRYYSGKPCLRGHVSYRYVSNGRCVKCQADDQHKRKPIVSEAMAKSSHSESSNPEADSCISEYDSGYRDGFLDGLIEVFDLVKNAADVREIKAGMFDRIVSVKEMYDERSE